MTDIFQYSQVFLCVYSFLFSSISEKGGWLSILSEDIFCSFLSFLSISLLSPPFSIGSLAHLFHLPPLSLVVLSWLLALLPSPASAKPYDEAGNFSKEK